MSRLEILSQWSQGKLPKTDEIAKLLRLELESDSIYPLGINEDEEIQKRQQHLALFQSLYPIVSQECQKQGLNNSQDNLITLWQLWLPLGLQLAEKRSEINRPFIQGILGGQGVGKTTLCSILILILQHLGYSALSLSIDDLYLNPEERQAKFPPNDPRYHYRGAPKTHNIEKGIDLLEQIKNNQKPLLIPRFDKSQNRGQGQQIEPQIVENLDILLFEGWFVGVRPIHRDQFNHLPKAILKEINLDYAIKINEDLQEYLPLWQALDSLMVLYPTDYHWSKQWRQRAEEEMKSKGKQGMSEVEIEQFVAYFWQSLHPELFITPLTHHPQTDLIIEINSNHRIKNITKK